MWTKVRSAKSIFINFKGNINPIVSLQKVVVFFFDVSMVGFLSIFFCELYLKCMRENWKKVILAFFQRNE